MTEKWLSIIGIGEDGLEGLSQAARTLVDTAEILVGGERHLAMVPEGTPDDTRTRKRWPSPFSALAEEIMQGRGRKTCILATGDPMCFGVGATLRHSIPWDEATVIPASSAFALACARMGWAADEVEFVTLHGRPIELIGAVLRPDAKIIALSHNAETVRSVADYLGARGYGDSEIIALCNMGGPNETRMSG
ncbi:MAG: precorrin-6y C5,15-methyltransferase (decarboxylating) subunit CbiE, partial [Pseudomonadota bacterium]